MSSSGKLFLCLVVLFCVFQAIVARPRFDGSFLEDVRYDLMKKCAGVERDFEKETLNVRHKILKDSMKLMKKATKEGSPECVESAKVEAEQQLEDKSQEIQDCIQELKDSLDSSLQPEAALSEIKTFRSYFKNKLQECKNSGKMGLKTVQNGFSAAGKACLI